MKIHRLLTHVCLHQIDCLCYCCYAETSSSAVQKRHSQVYGKPITPSLYYILLDLSHTFSFLLMIVFVQKGRKRKYFFILEILTPSLAWAFFGPDEHLCKLMNEFKTEVLGFLGDIFRQIYKFKFIIQCLLSISFPILYLHFFA